jgi:hypothetical protein
MVQTRQSVSELKLNQMATYHWQLNITHDINKYYKTKLEIHKLKKGAQYKRLRVEPWDKHL